MFVGSGHIIVLFMVNPLASNFLQPPGGLNINTQYKTTHFNKYTYPCSNLQNTSKPSSGSMNIVGKLRSGIIFIMLVKVSAGERGGSDSNQVCPKTKRDFTLSLNGKSCIITSSKVKSSTTFEGIWGKIAPESIDVLRSAIGDRFAPFLKKPKKTSLKSIVQFKTLGRFGLIIKSV